jgi:hypothetical protein
MPAVAQARRRPAALSHQDLTMNAETERTGLRRNNTVADLVAIAQTGRDEDVKVAVASLHPADAAELIILLERPETCGGESRRGDDRQGISVTVSADQEAVTQLFRKYDLVALPASIP